MIRTTSFRLLAALGVAALAACSDAPTGSQRQPDTDPVLARANELMGPYGRVLSLAAERKTVPLARPGAPSGEGAVASPDPISIPYYCEPDNTNPYCPQIIVGAAVWNNGTVGSTRHVNLYAHLDAMQNIASSDLHVYYGLVGGCTGTPGTFDSDHLTGGSSAGGPYALVGSRNSTFDGSSKWSVSALGQAQGTYGNFTDDSAWDQECTP